MKDFYATVIAKRRASHGLKDFIIQSDNGECKSDAVRSFLNSVGGELRTCCAYTPETMAHIERLWGIINNMATAMLLDKGLPTAYWEYAQKYALDIYNSIPPTKTPKGEEPRSPNEKFDGKKADMSLYQVFGCRAFAHSPKQKQRKNLDARANQGIFIGLDRSSYPRYMIYSPEFHTTYVSGDVVFHPNHNYDGTMSDRQAGETASEPAAIPVQGVDQFKYLEGTNHLDPDDGLLYRVMRVEEKNYRGQGTFIVAYRAQVLSDGRVSTKCEKDAFHVRDIERYYVEYMKRVKEQFPASLDSSIQVPGFHRQVTEQVPEQVPEQVTEQETGQVLGQTSREVRRTRSNTTRDSTFQALLTGESLPLFYSGISSSNSENRPEMGEYLHTAAVCHLDADVEPPSSESVDLEMYLEEAIRGDPIVHHCLATGVSVVPDDSEPNTIRQAYALPDRDKWRESVDVEMEMIRQFNVFSFPMLLPSGAKALNCRWVFKRKRDQFGNMIKYKARLTPLGCFQYFGVDYADTYAPVARMCTLRYVLALACLLGLQTSSCDFTNAFLNAELKEDVYINAPPGTPELPKGYVYKLQRALYGLKQSPREWNLTLNQFMTEECGFRQLQVEKCLYIKQNKDGSYMLVCMYVDDLVIAYSHQSMLNSFIDKVKTKFKITQSDSLQKTLGFQIERTRDGGVFMHQQSYINETINRFGLQDARTADTPIDHHVRLCKSGVVNVRTGVSSTTKSSTATQGERTVHTAFVGVAQKKRKVSQAFGEEPTVPYRELIGSLLWISMGTRPDISYAVNQCARYSSDPKPEHWTACLRILRYLKGTSDHGLHYHRHHSHYLGQNVPAVSSKVSMKDLKQPFSYASSFYPGDAKVNVFGYSDADYANNVDDRRSITGYVFVFAGAPLS